MGLRIQTKEISHFGIMQFNMISVIKRVTKNLKGQKYPESNVAETFKINRI